MELKEIPTLGKPISLINTPTHQRWWLPNKDYWYEVRLIGRYWKHRIVNNETQQEMEAYAFPADHGRLHELSLYAQGLAIKKYRKPPPMKGKHLARETVFYNVVNVKDMNRPLMSENNAFLHIAQTVKATLTIKYPKETFEIVEIETKG